MSWIVLLIVAIIFAIGLAVKPIAWWEGKWGWLLPLPVAWYFALAFVWAIVTLFDPAVGLVVGPMAFIGSGENEFCVWVCVWVAVLTAEYFLARRIRCALASKSDQWWRDATAADVRSALRRGSDVNAKHGAALRNAAKYSDPAVIELLIEEGADINADEPRPDGRGRLSHSTPLHSAASHGNIPAIDALLDRGAHSDASALHAAIHGKALHAATFLLDHGVDINGGALLHAVKMGNVEAIAMLLDRGADVNIQYSSGTPLYHAAERGNVEAIAMLLDHGADASLSVPSSSALHGTLIPLEIAVRENKWAAAGMLLLSREAAEDGLAPCVAGLSASGSCRTRMQPALELCPTCATPQWFFCPSCSRRVRGQQFEEPGEWRREPDKLVSAGDCIPCDLAGVRSWKAVPPNIKERLIGWGLKPPAIQPPRSARFPTSKPRGQSTRRDRSAVNRSGGEGAKYGVGAIPTRFRGRLYRSRLEARWAAFMSLCGWEHEYEPLDFNGWIPDFAIWGQDGNKVWVDVKPAESFPVDVAVKMEDGLPIEYRERGDRLLILGTKPSPMPYAPANRGHPRLGWLGRYAPSPDQEDWVWADCLFGRWTDDAPFGFCDPSLPYHDRITGERSGGRMPGAEGDDLARLWAEAGNLVQWRSPRDDDDGG